MREYEINGPKITAETEDEIRDKLQELAAESLQPYEGEVAKSPYLLRAIESFNEALRSMLQKYNVKAADSFAVAPERIHLIPRSKMSQGDALGTTMMTSGDIEVGVDLDPTLTSRRKDLKPEVSNPDAGLDKDVPIWDVIGERVDDQLQAEGLSLDDPEYDNIWRRRLDEQLDEYYRTRQFWQFQEGIRGQREREEHEEDVRLARIILHEMIHLVGFVRYSLDRGGSESFSARTGYHWQTQAASDKEYFYSLNEVVVDNLTEQIYSDFCQRLGETPVPRIQDPWALFSRNKKQTVERGYQPDIDLFTVIINNLAQATGQSSDQVWEKFSRGYFTGEMMHLRDIDHVFGKGSLRMYSTIGYRDLQDTDFKKLLLRYFTLEEARPTITEVKDNQNSTEHVHFLETLNQALTRPSSH